MSVRIALVLAMSLVASQMALASEDYDWGEPNTALWAIAREHRIVLDVKTEADQIVQAAVQSATATAQGLVDQQVSNWEAPIIAELAKVAAAGVNVTDSTCTGFYDDLSLIKREAEEGLSYCVVAARTQHDARVKKLQTAADHILDLIVEAQDKIQSCLAKGELMKYLCLQTKVTWVVLTAQDDIKRKAVDVYHEVSTKAAADIAQVAEACTAAVLERLQFSATMAIKNTVSCLETLIERE